MLTEEILRKIVPSAPKDLGKFVSPLNILMEKYEINTPQRQAMFIAQIAHESGGFRWTREIWGPTAQQRRYEPPSSLAKQLGNTQKGDGLKFKGRGLIMITGKANYMETSRQLFNDPVKLTIHPELLEDPYYAVASACLFWNKKRLNQLADAGNFEKVTRIINGGLTGYADRLQHLARANQYLTKI